MIRSIYSIRLRSFKYYYTCINKSNLLDMNLYKGNNLYSN